MSYPIQFIIPGRPVPKPRGRQLLIHGPKTPPGVVAWREFKARATRAAIMAGWKPDDPESLIVLVAAFFEPAKSLSKSARAALEGQPHRVKPDSNHVLNAVFDALFPRDERVSSGLCTKEWCRDGGALGERVVVWLGDVVPEDIGLWFAGKQSLTSEDGKA